MPSPASPPAPAAASLPATLRLYISPLSPSLLPAILPAALGATASDISYHAPQTFPETAYGYITLAAPDAVKLKAKLHGSILRGVKMRVEEARPDKRRKRTADDGPVSADDGANTTETAAEADSTQDPVADKGARRERRRLNRENNNGVLPAIELPEGRRVKRGWSQPDAGKDAKAKRGRRNDKEADKGDVVFRTHVPPNKASVAAAQDPKSPSRKSKRETNSSKPGKDVQVTEFDKTTKYPSFLRSNQVPADSKRAAEFVNGKGWVDDQGNTVEPEPAATRNKRRKHRQPTPSDHGSPAIASETSAQQANGAKEASPSDTSSPNNLTPTSAASEDAITTPTPAVAAVAAEAIAQPKPIHPLEALFKRPAPKAGRDLNGSVGPHRPAPIKTSFSFFSDQDDNDSGLDGGEAPLAMAPPQTPFTRHDMEMRGIRSAAPTPDTAALGRRFSMPWRRGTAEADEIAQDSRDDNDDNDDVDDHGDDDDDADDNNHDSDNHDTGAHDGSSSADHDSAKEPRNADGTLQNDFEKHFWQHRGDYNRAWKARKRKARKDVRQAENRKRSVGGH